MEKVRPLCLRGCGPSSWQDLVATIAHIWLLPKREAPEAFWAPTAFLFPLWAATLPLHDRLGCMPRPGGQHLPFLFCLVWWRAQSDRHYNFRFSEAFTTYSASETPSRVWTYWEGIGSRSLPGDQDHFYAHPWFLDPYNGTENTI